jgi:hypothetical protein
MKLLLTRPSSILVWCILLLFLRQTQGFIAWTTKTTTVSSFAMHTGLCMTSSSTTTQCTVDLKIQEFSKHTDTSTAPPVLLLNGLLGSKRNFSTIGASLAAQLLKIHSEQRNC